MHIEFKLLNDLRFNGSIYVKFVNTKLFYDNMYVEFVYAIRFNANTLIKCVHEHIYVKTENVFRLKASIYVN